MLPGQPSPDRHPWFPYGLLPFCGSFLCAVKFHFRICWMAMHPGPPWVIKTWLSKCTRTSIPGNSSRANSRIWAAAFGAAPWTMYRMSSFPTWSFFICRNTAFAARFMVRPTPNLSRLLPASFNVKIGFKSSREPTKATAGESLPPRLKNSKSWGIR